MRPKYANLRRIEDRLHGFTGARNPQRHHRESRGAASACLLVTYLSVEQFYFFADNEQLISDLETSQPARATNNPAPPIKLSQAALNLFGESGKAPVKEVVAAPETRLNLELQNLHQQQS